MTEKERCQYFAKQALRIRELFKSDKIPTDEIYFVLDKLKQYMFSFANKDEKAVFVELALKYIIDDGKLAYHMIELLSIIYKELQENLQKDIFKVVFPICFDLLSENRGITTVSIFIKNTHKAYSAEQREQCLILLNELKKRCVTDALRDTYDYTYNNYWKEFIPSDGTKVLLLIAELQTATSFLQPPLCFLSVCTQLKQRNISFDFLDNRVYSYSNSEIAGIAEHYDITAITSSPLDQVQTYFLDHRYTIFCHMVNAIKEQSADSKIIVCGAHGSIKPDFVFNATWADVILQGEYEFQLAINLATK